MDLPLPPELEALIDGGHWPRTEEQQRLQNLNSPIAGERLRKLIPEEPELILYAPPFTTVADELNLNAKFWTEHGALDEIDPARTLMIGDFGLGSDSALVLDYRQDPPLVLYLKWGSEGNHWWIVSPTFAKFAAALGLNDTHW